MLLVVTVAIPIANQLTAPGSALHVPTYAVTLVGKYLCYALLALALDLVWGFFDEALNGASPCCWRHAFRRRSNCA